LAADARAAAEPHSRIPAVARLVATGEPTSSKRAPYPSPAVIIASGELSSSRRIWVRQAAAPGAAAKPTRSRSTLCNPAAVVPLAVAVNTASEMLPSTPMPGLQSAAARWAGAEHSEGAALPAAVVQGLQRCAGLNRLSLQPPPVSRPLTMHEAMAATQSPATPRRPADLVTERPSQRPLTGMILSTQPGPRLPTAAAAAEAKSAMEGVQHLPTQAGTEMEGVQRPPVEAGTVAGPLPPQRPLPQPTPSPLATTSPPPPEAEDAASNGPRQSE